MLAKASGCHENRSPQYTASTSSKMEGAGLGRGWANPAPAEHLLSAGHQPAEIRDEKSRLGSRLAMVSGVPWSQVEQGFHLVGGHGRVGTQA